VLGHCWLRLTDPLVHPATRSALICAPSQPAMGAALLLRLSLRSEH